MSHPYILHPLVAFSGEILAREQAIPSSLELAQGLLSLERDLEPQRPGRLTIPGSVKPCRAAAATTRSHHDSCGPDASMERRLLIVSTCTAREARLPHEVGATAGQNGTTGLNGRSCLSRQALDTARFAGARQ